MSLDERIQPLKDMRCCVTSEFNINIDKIEGVITGLDTDGLISGTLVEWDSRKKRGNSNDGISGTPSSPQDTLSIPIRLVVGL